MLKAVLFDMDGVIVDTEPLHKKAYFKMFEEVAIPVSETMYEGFTGQSTLNICKQLCDHFELSEAPETLVSIKRKHFKFLFENDTSLALLDGVLDRIRDYHSNGLTLVLASSASIPNIDRIFRRFDLDKYFVAKLSGADLKASKPHPEIFLKASEASGHPVQNCMVIEDSTNGNRRGPRPRIFFVWVIIAITPRIRDYSKADLVVANFNEIAFNIISKKF